MEFQYAPETKQFILDHGAAITIQFQSEECYACCGKQRITFPIVQIGKPEDSQQAAYEIIHTDELTIYIEKSIYQMDSSLMFAIVMNPTKEPPLDLYGVTPN